MNAIKNFNEIENFTPIAHDLIELLGRVDNQDVAAEFPGSVARYTGNADQVIHNLIETKYACRPGVRQQFIAFAGERAVGISAVRFADEVPSGIEPSWPNVSGFVCSPYRNRGIGRMSLLERLKVVDSQFNGNAWTKVKQSNIHSHRMVTHAGFEVIGEDNDSFVYAYHA
ncbi:MAG: hypothetical protein JWO15_3826 [Sphingomonadales bacterium]|nr:hypothetical protein [Sphingomonadales bacterium]